MKIKNLDQVSKGNSRKLCLLIIQIKYKKTIIINKQTIKINNNKDKDLIIEYLMLIWVAWACRRQLRKEICFMILPREH